MDAFLPLLIAAVVLAALFFLLTFVCFYLVFFVPRHRPPDDEDYRIPPGKIYEPHRDVMVAWMKEARHTAHEDVSSNLMIVSYHVPPDNSRNGMYERKTRGNTKLLASYRRIG